MGNKEKILAPMIMDPIIRNFKRTPLLMVILYLFPKEDSHPQGI